MVGNSYVAIEQDRFILVDSVLKATTFINNHLSSLFSKIFETNDVEAFGVL